MISWEAKVIEDNDEILSYAGLFKNAFPNRSVTFFKKLLSNLSKTRANLVVLETHDKKIAGAVILFKLEGYHEQCWAPSYFFVSNNYRNLGIPFIIKAQKIFSVKIVNVTPNDSMCNILKAMRYKNFTYGSKIFFNFSRFFKLFKKMNRRLSLITETYRNMYNIDTDFFTRKDLSWIPIIIKDKKILFCFKKTHWFGVPLQILVYSAGVNNREIRKIIAKTDLSSLGFSFIVYPRMHKSYFKWNPVSKKFRVFGNFDMNQNFYSILGSEVTEIL